MGLDIGASLLTVLGILLGIVLGTALICATLFRPGGKARP